MNKFEIIRNKTDTSESVPSINLPFCFECYILKIMRLISVFLAIVFLSSCAASKERQQNDVVWTKVNDVEVPLPPLAHPRLFLRSGDIAQLKEKMNTPEGKSILKQLQKASLPRTPQEEAEAVDRGFRYYAQMRGVTSEVQLQALDYLGYAAYYEFRN